MPKSFIWPKPKPELLPAASEASAPSTTWPRSACASPAKLSAKKRQSAGALFGWIRQRPERQIGAARGKREQPEIGRRARQSALGLASRDQIAGDGASLHQAPGRPRPTRSPSGRSLEIGRTDGFDSLVQFVDIAVNLRTAGLRQFSQNKVDRLDAVGAFVDRRDARVAQETGGARLLDEAHAAMHLKAKRGDLDADIGREGLGDGRQKIGAFLPMRFHRRRSHARAMSVAWAQE